MLVEEHKLVLTETALFQALDIFFREQHFRF
jgi:hypothetical protein